jgi:sugar/nucleoside kinase (ribokinase family)
VVLQEIRATAAGTAAGPAVDLAKLGAQVSAIGALGDDVIADIIVAILERHGVDTAGLARRPGVQTAATMLPIRPNGERPALHVPGAMTQLRPADIFTFNDLASARADAAAAGDDLAGILVGPFLHDAGFDQELVDRASPAGCGRSAMPPARP